MNKQTLNAPSQLRGALKIGEAAEYLGGLSTITVRRLIARGLLKPSRATRHIIVSISELDRFLSETQSKP